MGQSGPIVVQLQIDREDERIAGSLSTPSGLVVPFTGWLGLAAAIERAAAVSSEQKMRDDPS